MMNRILRWSIGLLVFLIAFYSAIWYYDTHHGNDDGLIERIAFHNVFEVVLIWWLVGTVLIAGLSSHKGWVKTLAFHTSMGVGTLVLLEGICLVLAHTKVMDTGLINNARLMPPKDLTTVPHYAGDVNRLSGRWRIPHSRDTLFACSGDTLYRRANQWGAADTIRQAIPADPKRSRVYVAGDSFLEGFMVQERDRVSNRLEKATGHEHLNFAINGTSPINYWLLYKQFGRQIAHDVVLVGLLPGNDFEDYTPERFVELIDYPLYRPYWSDATSPKTLRYSLACITHSIGAINRSPVRVLETVDSLYRHLSFAQKIDLHFIRHSYLVKTFRYLAQQGAQRKLYTRYETFSEPEWDNLADNLDHLRREAAGKRLLFVSIPILSDVQAIRKGHQNRFDARMRDFCRQRGIAFLPLMPHFAAYTGDLNELYVPCDGHWSAKGEAIAADIILRDADYQRMLRTPEGTTE